MTASCQLWAHIAHFFLQGYSPIFSLQHKMGKETE
ncbi:hypothetical protein I656_03387 [Geobacillus sp. WSUCF1]|nr:hypothetical protein I656_03387 [Geobacillus sp. WSUCF1]